MSPHHHASHAPAAPRWSDTVVVADRFIGPPKSGNGGYTAGLLLERVGAAAEITLFAPVPIDTTLSFVDEPDGCSMHGPDGARIARARRATPLAAPPVGVDFRTAAAASANFGARARAAHVFPTCFVCGPQRSCEDALCIFSGRPVGASHGPVYGTWTPQPWTDGSHTGLCDQRYLVSALDCPGGWAAMPSTPVPMVLGRMTIRVCARPEVGERCVTVGAARGVERRKHFAASAIYGEGGRLLGHSEQVWIRLGQ